MEKKPEPIYAKIERDIQQKIKERKLNPDQHIPSENLLSKQYGISRSSVRTALDNLKKQGVIYTLAGKGSFVKGYGIIKETNKRIAFIVPGLENSDFDIYKGMEDTLKEEGFTLAIYNSERNIEKENQNIKNLLHGNETGAIIFPNWGGTNADVIYELMRVGYPFVLIDRYFPGFETDYVVTDNKRGGYMATEHLIKLGHENIGLLSGIQATAIRDRIDGYQDAIRDNNILLNLSLVKKVPQNDKYLKEEPSNGGYNETKQLLKEKPTAIFTTNDFLARTALKAIREEGLSVPDDISIIGFDNQRFAEYFGLTTISQPFYKIGVQAAKILIGKIMGEREKKQVSLQPELVIRTSCAAYPSRAEGKVLTKSEEVTVR